MSKNKQEERREGFQFQGFKPRNKRKYLYVPDIIYDKLPHQYCLSALEIRVLDYLIRQLDRGKNHISLKRMLEGTRDEKGKYLDWGCGIIYRSSLVRALRKLKKLNIVVSQQNYGENGSYKASGYRLSLDETESHVESLYAQGKMSDDKFKETYQVIAIPTESPIPNIVFDRLLGILSNSEYLVLRYICRHTFGWKKSKDCISLSQMSKGIVKKDGTRLDWGCGLKDKATIVKAAKQLAERGIIKRQQRKTDSGRDLATEYQLCLAKISGKSTNLSRCISQHHLEASANPSGCVSQHSLGTLANTQKTNKQKTNKQQQRGNHVVAFLQKQGFSEPIANELAQNRTLAYVQEKAEFLAFEQERGQTAIQNPLAWLRSAIEKDYGSPTGFKSHEKRQKEVQQAQKERKRVQSVYAEIDQQLARQKQKEQENTYRQYQQAYHTTTTDLQKWRAFKECLLQTGDLKYFTGDLFPLKIDVEQGWVVIGTHNSILIQFQKELKLVVGQVMREVFGLEQTQLLLEVMKSVSTAIVSPDKVDYHGK